MDDQEIKIERVDFVIESDDAFYDEYNTDEIPINQLESTSHAGSGKKSFLASCSVGCTFQKIVLLLICWQMRDSGAPFTVFGFGHGIESDVPVSREEPFTGSEGSRKPLGRDKLWKWWL